jgi:hypothetical protein
MDKYGWDIICFELSLSVFVCHLFVSFISGLQCVKDTAHTLLLMGEFCWCWFTLHRSPPLIHLGLSSFNFGLY